MGFGESGGASGGSAEPESGGNGAGGSGPSDATGGTGSGSANGGMSADGGNGGKTTTGGTGGKSTTGGNGGSSAGGNNAGGATATGGASASGDPLAYFAKECATCHGDKGEGNKDGPEILHPVRDFATWVIRNGRAHPSYAKPMKKYGEDVLPAASLTAILNFLDQPQKPTTGQGLFLDYCGNCHGNDGRGGVTGRSIKTASSSRYTSLVRSGHSAGQFSSRRGYMPKWSATQLTSSEIGLIHTYVTGQ